MLTLILGAANAQEPAKTEKKKHKVVMGGDGVYLRDSTWRIGGYLGVLVSQTAIYQWGQIGRASCRERV